MEDASGSLDEADFSDGIIVVLQRLSDAVWRERDIVTKAKSQLLKGAVRAVIMFASRYGGHLMEKLSEIWVQGTDEGLIKVADEAASRGDHSLALSLYSLFLGMPWTLRVLQQVDSTLGVLHALFVGACPNWAEVESSMTPAEFEERNLAVVNSMGLVLNLWEQTSSNQQTNLAARTLLSRAQDKILPSIMRVVRLSCLRNGGPAGSSSCCTASSRGRDAGSWPPPALFPYASSVSIRLLQGLMIMSLCDSMHSPQAEGGVLHRPYVDAWIEAVCLEYNYRMEDAERCQDAAEQLSLKMQCRSMACNVANLAHTLWNFTSTNQAIKLLRLLASTQEMDLCRGVSFIERGSTISSSILSALTATDSYPADKLMHLAKWLVSDPASGLAEAVENSCMASSMFPFSSPVAVRAALRLKAIGVETPNFNPGVLFSSLSKVGVEPFKDIQLFLYAFTYSVSNPLQLLLSPTVTQMLCPTQWRAEPGGSKLLAMRRYSFVIAAAICQLQANGSETILAVLGLVEQSSFPLVEDLSPSTAPGAFPPGHADTLRVSGIAGEAAGGVSAGAAGVSTGAAGGVAGGVSAGATGAETGAAGDRRVAGAGGVAGTAGIIAGGLAGIEAGISTWAAHVAAGAIGAKGVAEVAAGAVGPAGIAGVSAGAERIAAGIAARADGAAAGIAEVAAGTIGPADVAGVSAEAAGIAAGAIGAKGAAAGVAEKATGSIGPADVAGVSAGVAAEVEVAGSSYTAEAVAQSSYREDTRADSICRPEACAGIHEGQISHPPSIQLLTPPHTHPHHLPSPTHPPISREVSCVVGCSPGAPCSPCESESCESQLCKSQSLSVPLGAPSRAKGVQGADTGIGSAIMKTLAISFSSLHECGAAGSSKRMGEDTWDVSMDVSGSHQQGAGAEEQGNADEAGSSKRMGGDTWDVAMDVSGSHRLAVGAGAEKQGVADEAGSSHDRLAEAEKQGAADEAGSSQVRQAEAKMQGAADEAGSSQVRRAEAKQQGAADEAGSSQVRRAEALEPSVKPSAGNDDAGSSGSTVNISGSCDDTGSSGDSGRGAISPAVPAEALEASVKPSAGSDDAGGSGGSGRGAVSSAVPAAAPEAGGKPSAGSDNAGGSGGSGRGAVSSAVPAVAPEAGGKPSAGSDDAGGSGGSGRGAISSEVPVAKAAPPGPPSVAYPLPPGPPSVAYRLMALRLLLVIHFRPAHSVITDLMYQLPMGVVNKQIMIPFKECSLSIIKLLHQAAKLAASPYPAPATAAAQDAGPSCSRAPPVRQVWGATEPTRNVVLTPNELALMVLECAKLLCMSGGVTPLLKSTMVSLLKVATPEPRPILTHRYLNNARDSNIRLLLGDGQIYHAHRIALEGTDSSVFVAMLSDDMDPSVDPTTGIAVWQVPLPRQFSMNEVDAAMRWVYTGSLIARQDEIRLAASQGVRKLRGVAPGVSPEALLRIADHFDLKKLKALVERLLTVSVLEGMQLDQFSIFSTESPFEAPHRYGTQAQLLDLHTFAVQHNAISLQTTCAIALLRNWQQPLAPPPALTTHHASHPSHLSGTQASAISNNLATARDPPHFTSPVLDSGLAQLLEAVIHGYDPRSSAKSWVKALLDSIPDPTSSVTNDPYQQDNSAHEGGMSGYEYEMDPDDVYLGNTARHIPDDEAAINSGYYVEGHTLFQ